MMFSRTAGTDVIFKRNPRFGEGSFLFSPALLTPTVGLEPSPLVGKRINDVGTAKMMYVQQFS